MRLFATRVWGNPVGGDLPMATFGSDGHMNRLLVLAKPGDRLVFIGTKTERTAPDLRGRILSMAEFGYLRLKTLDYWDAGELDPRDFDERGIYKFPYGVPITKGWVFDPKPFLNETIMQRLTMLATPGVEEIREQSDVDAILALSAQEHEFKPIPAVARMQRLNDMLRPTTGPTPSNSTYTVERSAMETSWTYAFQFGKHSLYKIGHTTNVAERLKAVNQHIPVEIGIAQWSAIFQQKWADAITAHAMEQKVLEILATKRTGFERVGCSSSELWEAWQRAIVGE